MAIGVVWDTREMTTALKRYATTTKKTVPVILNQRVSNMSRRAFNFTPPKNVDNERQRVRAYLRQPLATRIKTFTSGKRKGKIGKKAATNKQLQRVHKIVNKLRGKSGRRGLYGKAMLRMSGAFVKERTNAVGFAKSLWIPMQKKLEKIVKFRGIRIKRGNIKIWNAPSGYSTVVPATPGSNPTVRFTVGADVKKTEYRLQLIVVQAARRATAEEAREIVRHVEEKAKKAAKKTGVA